MTGAGVGLPVAVRVPPAGTGLLNQNQRSGSGAGQKDGGRHEEGQVAGGAPLARGAASGGSRRARAAARGRLRGPGRRAHALARALAAEGTHHLEEVRQVLRSPVGALLEAAHDGVGQVARHVGTQVGERRGPVGRGAPPREHLVEDDARGVDVGLERMGRALRDLGRPVAEAPPPAARAAVRSQVPSLCHLDGARLEAPMQRAALVAFVERAAKALDDLELVGEGAILFEPVFEGHAMTPRLPSVPGKVKRGTARGRAARVESLAERRAGCAFRARFRRIHWSGGTSGSMRLPIAGGESPEPGTPCPPPAGNR